MSLIEETYKSKRSKCYSCNHTSHKYGGRCLVCGASERFSEVPFERLQGLSDDNYKEIAGMFGVILIFMALALIIAILVATFG